MCVWERERESEREREKMRVVTSIVHVFPIYFAANTMILCIKKISVSNMFSKKFQRSV